MAFEKEHSLGFLSNHLARLMAHGLQKRLAPLDLAPAQFMVLLELWEEDGLTQTDLVARLDVEQATMANTLTRMERDGLIIREKSVADRRARIVVLTEAARSRHAEAIIAAQEQNRIALHGLDENEQAELIRLIGKVISNLKRY
ncbi:MAG: MarR family transcriptional regulator [Rhodobacteraceae bacterium]|nr:MarR family transcriptional regulator [Paracoccaceae bacterium]